MLPRCSISHQNIVVHITSVKCYHGSTPQNGYLLYPPDKGIICCPLYHIWYCNPASCTLYLPCDRAVPTVPPRLNHMLIMEHTLYPYHMNIHQNVANRPCTNRCKLPRCYNLTAHTFQEKLPELAIWHLMLHPTANLTVHSMLNHQGMLPSHAIWHMLTRRAVQCDHVTYNVTSTMSHIMLHPASEYIHICYIQTFGYNIISNDISDMLEPLNVYCLLSINIGWGLNIY
jgi:hypothetical protein